MIDRIKDDSHKKLPNLPQANTSSKKQLPMADFDPVKSLTKAVESKTPPPYIASQA